MSRLYPIAGVLLAMAIGIGSAVLLVLWGTCSQEAAMCALVSALPTRPGWWSRLRRAAHARQLRLLIRAAEFDLHHHEQDLARMPEKIASTRRHIGLLRVRLACCETGREAAQ